MQLIQGKKYLWNIPTALSDSIFKISSKYNIGFGPAQILINRKLTDFDEIDSYLFSSFEKDVFCPSRLKDADLVVDRILKAIENKEKILAFGDYDVDGITSCSLMMSCLLPLKADINFYIPHRVREGYGLSCNILEKAVKNGYSVVITVDNGITAFEPAILAKKLNIDLIITDHHRPHDHVPEAYAIVNPYQKDCNYPFKGFAGVGVIFKIMSLLYKRLNLELPTKVYELLLLGTVADVVPLKGENRFWVRHGLKLINKAESISMQVLKENGKIHQPTIGASDIGFRITPQINALGRLEDSRQGVQFLIGTSLKDTRQIGMMLFSLNQTRKDIEKNIFNEVMNLIKTKQIDLEKENIILASSKNWQPGVIGLVASRLMSEFNRPVLLFHETSQGIAKGSCRSISSFNIFNALQDNSDLLIQFGGHYVAAGLALKIDNLFVLKNRLEERIIKLLKSEDFVKKLNIDATIDLQDVNMKLIKDLQLFEPFGAENSQPNFCIKNLSILQKPQLLKDDHVKCMVFSDGIAKPIMFFNRPELYNFFDKLKENETFDVVATATVNYWNGKQMVELLGVDVSSDNRVL